MLALNMRDLEVFIDYDEEIHSWSHEVYYDNNLVSTVQSIFILSPEEIINTIFIKGVLNLGEYIFNDTTISIDSIYSTQYLYQITFVTNNEKVEITSVDPLTVNQLFTILDCDMKTDGGVYV